MRLLSLKVIRSSQKLVHAIERLIRIVEDLVSSGERIQFFEFRLFKSELLF